MPNSVEIHLPEPLAVVCHDAGASNLIISWLKHYAGVVRACAQGQAAALWPQAFPDATPLPLEVALRGASALLSGTGWGSDLEHKARKLAREHGIPNVAAVDHWVNYRERFIRDGEIVLPDELWVADDEAYAEAKRCFPGLPIRQLRNLYLEGLVAEIAVSGAQAVRETPENILYVLEPIRQKWGLDERPEEVQAFEYFMNYLTEIGLVGTTHIRLRPHPSDRPGQYDHWPMSYPHADIAIDSTTSLPQQIAWADWVVGCESFALVIALHAKRVVISTLPPSAPPCRLPQRELRHLRDLVRPAP